MSGGPSGAIPPLSPGDVYVYSHANGAILVKHADGRSMLAPLDEVVAIAEGAHTGGARVLAAWDETSLATHVIDRLRTVGVPVVEFEASQPPHSWAEGTTALMEAAANGSDRILDDLIARGADVHERDDSGSTAVHHAAANGSVHAIDRLAEAGADLDLVNDRGFSPHMLAMACRQPLAAQRLVELGAKVSSGPASAVEFSRAHYGTFYVWLLPLIIVAALVAFAWPLTRFAFVGLVAYAVVFSLVVPPPAFWSGGVPRRLEATSLVVRGVTGRRRTIDLRDVTVLATGGSTSRSASMGARWLLLGHPEGSRATARTLRRLFVPREEAEVLAGRLQRVFVVVLDGARRDEVILAVGNLLSGRGVDMSATARMQLVRARSADA